MLRRYLRWFLISILSILLVFMVIGLSYESYSSHQAKKKYLSQGTYLEINGHRMHYNAQGSGKLTVVFESGLDAGGSLAWAKVQPEVSKFARTFTYDRAGLLKSERGKGPKTGAEMAKDLYALLQASGHKGPYLLVGQSAAGFILRSFISRYPTAVAGIVFVDVSHPQQLKRFPALAASLNKMPADWIIRMANDFGLIRLFYKNYYPSTTKSDTVNEIRNDLFPSSLPGILEEKNAFKTLAAEAGRISSFGDIPLTIITGTGKQRDKDFKDPEAARQFPKIWLQLQQELLLLSTKHKQILATESGHQVNFDQPDVVINAIQELYGQYLKDADIR